MGIKQKIQSKYGIEITSIDIDLMDKTVYEVIDMLVNNNKKISLDKVSKLYTGTIASMDKDVKFVLDLYSSSGILFKITDKTDYELKSLGIFSRNVFKNIAYVASDNSIVTSYTNSVYLKYIPTSSYYVYSGTIDEVGNMEYVSELLSSVYAKNYIVNNIISVYSSNKDTYNNLKTLIEDRLASDDIEIASGYMQNLGIDIQSIQGMIATNESLFKDIASDINTILESLR